MAWSNFFPMNDTGISNAPQRKGVYQLNDDKGTLYIGQTINLQRRLLEHLSSNDHCIQRAIEFAFLEDDDPEGLEDRILKKIKADHGDTPPCND